MIFIISSSVYFWKRSLEISAALRKSGMITKGKNLIDVREIVLVGVDFEVK